MVKSTDLHRVFIQTLLSRRFMREETALELYKRAVNVIKTLDDIYEAKYDTDSAGLASFMQEISTLLSDFGMDVKRGREDTKNGKWWYALVNTEAQGAGAFASDYAPVELTFFREIVSEIVDSYPAYSIGSFQALKLASLEGIKLAKSAAQALLVTFVSRGYLVQSKRGRYALGPRGVLELESYLVKEGNVNKCDRCRKLVFVGKACSKDGCNAHLHLYCYNTVVGRSNLGAACPSCRSSFDDFKPNDIGEKAVANVEDDFRELNRKRKRKGRASRVEERGSEDETDEGDEDDVEYEEADRTQTQTQARTRNRGSGVQVGGEPSQGTSSLRGRGQPSVIPETQLE